MLLGMIFANVSNMDILLRVWDKVFYCHSVSKKKNPV